MLVGGPLDPATERAVTFRRDGRRLAVLDDAGVLSVYDTADGRQLHRAVLAWRAWHPDLHPTEPTVALASGKNAVIYNLQTANVVNLEHPLAPVDSVAWGPDGRTLAVGCANRTIYVWDALAQRKQFLLTGHKTPGVTVSFNKTGTVLASNDWTGAARLWAMPWGGPVSIPLSVRGDPRFGSDPNRIACCHEGLRLRIYRVTHAPEFRQSPHHPDWARFCLFHPTGRWL